MTFCGICINLYAFRRLQAYVERELNLAKKRKLFLTMRAAVIKAVKARPFKPRPMAPPLMFIPKRPKVQNA